MLLETHQPADIGARLDLRFRLPGEELELRTVGLVVRAVPAARLTLGVSFSILRDTPRDRIRSFAAAAGA